MGIKNKDNEVPAVDETTQDAGDAGAAVVDVADMTVEQFREQYPDFANWIAETTAADVAKLTVEQFRKSYPELYGRIADAAAKEAQSAAKAKLNKKGFVLDRNDPFAEGAVRDYNRLKKADERVPFVLDLTDRTTPEILEKYIVRAAGGGDSKRAAAAGDALKKIGKKAK